MSFMSTKSKERKYHMTMGIHKSKASRKFFQNKYFSNKLQFEANLGSYYFKSLESFKISRCRAK